MNPEAMSEALNTIHDLAVSLTRFELPEEASRRVGLIISVSRYKFNSISPTELEKIRNEKDENDEDA